MGLYRCAKCDCCENTALGLYWTRDMINNFDWTGLEDYKGMPLCSECAPKHFSNGTPTGSGQWHNLFPKKPFDEVVKLRTE